MLTLVREIQTELNAWASNALRLPLILRGARQVGKSTEVVRFGKERFSQFHEFNFQKMPSLREIFDGDLEPKYLLPKLELRSRTRIQAEKDLVFFDEIQECPRALTSLKYFAEQMPTLSVVGAGSYLGLIKAEVAFPVGKVNFLSMFPLTFSEFLLNCAPKVYEFWREIDMNSMDPIDSFWHQQLLEQLTLYLCVGGMPKAVARFCALSEHPIEGAQAAREIQSELVTSYESDFSKHSGAVNANHILRVFGAIASQLGQAQDESVQKFKFTGVIPSQKGFGPIAGPLTWLEKSRLTIKSHLISKVEHPLRAFIQENKFKSYLFDIGILHAMLDTPIEVILNSKTGLYKGFVAENFVAQEFFAKEDQSLLSWTEGQSEIEFLLVRKGDIHPLEVKASSRSRQSKSLRGFTARYQPAKSYKFTGQNRGVNSGIWTLPLYLIGRVVAASPPSS